jgi:transposase
MNIVRVGIDIAKHKFQLCALNQANKVVFNRQVDRSKLLDQVRQLPAGILIALEACAGAHFWGRTFASLGFETRLIPPQHVKAFTRVHKTDGADALAIAEAADRPQLHPVPIKSVEQQDLAMLMKLRDGFIVQRTRTINQLHGFAHEYGVCLPTRSRARLCERLMEVLDDGKNSLSATAREALRDLWADVLRLDARIAAQLLRAQTLASSGEASAFARLQTLPGVGPVVATILLGAVGSGVQFRCGRQLATWAGLVPRQHGSGGKTQLLGITKNGHRQLRTMLIHGARAVVTWIDRRNDALGDWVKGLLVRRGFNRTVVALANKIARMAWIVLRTETAFDVNLAFRPRQAASVH